MRLTDPGGDTVSLHVSGHQFPQADDASALQLAPDRR